ncbi:MAG: class I SAM-dependent methyltransferase [archaeon]
MKKKINEVYLREEFLPSPLSILINPNYFDRRGLFNGIKSNTIYLKGKLLDFGCGNKPYKSLFNVKEYIGLDIEESGHAHHNENIDVYYDGNTIPFDDCTFDSIFSSEVFEHVFNLEQILRELYRVLKPGGHILVTLPFVWEEHEIPFDFARYTSFGIKNLMEKQGFKIVKLEKSNNYIEVIFQLCIAYLYRYVLPSRFKRVFTPLLIGPITFMGVILSRILPKNYNCYLSNIIVAQK